MTTIKMRRGLAVQWASVNPVLSSGETGYETDTNKVKYGDGVTAWNSLPYFSVGEGGSGGPSESGYYYPTAYGASGNGTTNDAAAIQQAIDAAAAAGGGTVFLAKRYAWSGILTVKNGVYLQGVSTRQTTGLADAPTIPGLIALDGSSQLRVGDWSGVGAGKPGGVKNLYVDGNQVGAAIGVVTKAGLVRIAGVDVEITGLVANRSAGDGIVYDGLQNSTIVGGSAVYALGTALVLDNGCGALSFHGGYYGTSKKGAFVFRDTVGENSLYPFGPVQNNFFGTIFESYAQMEPQAFHGHIRCGLNNNFYGCNFTSGANNDVDCSILIDDQDSTIVTQTTFDNCVWWTYPNTDAVRVVGTQIVTFSGHHLMTDNGTDHALATICIDGGIPHISIDGEILPAGNTGGTKIFRVINGGLIQNCANLQDTGTMYRLRTGQVVAFRRETDTAHRAYIDRDGAFAWFDGTSPIPKGYIMGATTGVDLVSTAGPITLKGGNTVVDKGLEIAGPLVRRQISLKNAATTETIDAALSHVWRFYWTSGAATAFTITNPVAGGEVIIDMFAQTSPSTPTWASNIEFAGNTPPVVAADTKTSISFRYDSTYSKWFEISRVSGVPLT